jgi:RES domain-containing protein
VTPLPAPLGSGDLIAWRLDNEAHSKTWDSGIGAAAAGGRWNSEGIHAVYCSLDPATAILELAVHVGFDALDTVPRTLTSLRLTDPARIHIVQPADVPNPHWLHPGQPTPGQQRFGSERLREHGILVIPSVVSTHSWNLIFLAGHAGYRLLAQERFALDPRLAA